MRAVVQLVSQASVSVSGEPVSSIGPGLLVLLGVAAGDGEKEADYLVEKIVHLRIFQDDKGLMNRSLQDTGGEMLVVSQFTLLADCRKGRRPSYNQAAPPAEANALYEYFIKKAAGHGITVKGGRFQAMMDVSLTNQGPVTIMLDSGKSF